MPKFLFWNINRKPLERQVADLSHEHEVDVLVLAESRINADRMLSFLNEGKGQDYKLPLDMTEGEIAQFYISYPGENLILLSDAHRVAIRKLVLPVGEDILVAALHLPSKLHSEQPDQTLAAMNALNAIKEAEQSVGHNRTVVLGDFNMNPFDEGMVGVQGFHSVMDREVARTGSRKVSGQTYDFLYNPMWGRMGDMSEGRPGTYFHSRSEAVNFFWHTFDQVLLRPSLIDSFRDASLQVLESAGDVSLVNENGRPSLSDHLPLLFEVRIEEVLS